MNSVAHVRNDAELQRSGRGLIISHVGGLVRWLVYHSLPIASQLRLTMCSVQLTEAGVRVRVDDSEASDRAEKVGWSACIAHSDSWVSAALDFPAVAMD